MFNVVLYQPEIPGNTGSIGRTCVALGLRLILIKPYGFEITEKALRRAGLDYWKHVRLSEYEDWEDFCKGEQNPSDDRLFFFSRFASESYFKADFSAGDHYLIFGAETQGLPQAIKDRYAKRLYTVPMNSEHIRSLNLANVTTAVCYESLRQIQFRK